MGNVLLKATRYAYDGFRESQPMPGVIRIITNALIGRIIDYVLVLLEYFQDIERTAEIEYPIKAVVEMAIACNSSG